jgi:hypothetical protein
MLAINYLVPGILNAFIVANCIVMIE